MSGHYNELLQDLIDGRLAPDMRSEVEAHLAVCTKCAADRHRLEVGRSAAHALRVDRDLPDGSLEALQRLIDREPVARRDADRVLPAPWRGYAAAAAAAVLLLAGLWWGTRPDPLPDLAARDFDAVSSGTIALDLTSRDATTLETFLNAVRAGPRLRVLDLDVMGFALEGGRRHTIPGQAPGGLYVYRNAAGERLVCQMFEGRLADLPPTSDVRDNGPFRFQVYRQDGVTVVFWQEGAIVCVLASRLPTEEVVVLAFAKAMAP
jgi:anti-sigma factor RsiW